MGGYSSWALFSLCHHLLVQYSAAMVYGSPSKLKSYEGASGPWFTKYRILGDDIVLWDKLVATEYRKNLTLLGVSISKPKSHISLNTYEMAKR